MKAVLFDLDGVIIDSELVMKIALTLSYKQVVGVGDPPIEEYFKHMGDSFENIMKKLSLPLEMKEYFIDYSKKLINFVIFNNDFIDVFDTLISKEIKMAIITGKDKERTQEILKRFNIEKYFDIVIASDEVSNPKPHPESILKALDFLNVESNEVIMVGDSPYDLMSATNASVKSCAVTWGTSSKDELLKQSPNFILDTPSQLLNVLE